jgi:hypothetical protein
MATSLIGKLASASSAKELDALQKQLKELRDANQQLQETVSFQRAIAIGCPGRRGQGAECTPSVAPLQPPPPHPTPSLHPHRTHPHPHTHY